MDAALYDFLSTLISGTVGIAEDLLSGIPYAKDAIMWSFFAYLVMNLIVLPIRGVGMSDRALARDIRAGRADSTRAIMQSRRQGKALQNDAYTRLKNRGMTKPRSFDDF